jgi:hypothetical protein
MNGYRTDASTFVPQLSGQTGLESSVEAGFDVHLRPEIRSRPYVDNAAIVSLSSGVRIVYCHTWADHSTAGRSAIAKHPGGNCWVGRADLGADSAAGEKRKEV